MGLEIGLNILEKSWKSFGKSLEKMCGNPEVWSVPLTRCSRCSGFAMLNILNHSNQSYRFFEHVYDISVPAKVVELLAKQQAV